MRRFLGSLLFLAACSHGSGTTTTVPATQMVGVAGGVATSTDGKLALTIPAGALGGDTMITIRPVTRAELDPALQGTDIEAAYELGPDGLQFAQPVRVALRLGGVPGKLEAELVMLLTESGGTIDAASSLVVEVDGDTGESFVSGEITHFSRLIAMKSGVTAQVTGVPDSLSVGGQFFVTARVYTSAASQVDSGVELWSLASAALRGPGGSVNLGHLRGDVENDIDKSDGPFTCAALGTGTFEATFTFTDLTFVRGEFTSTRVEIQFVTFVDHVDSSPDEAQDFQTDRMFLERLKAVPTGFIETGPDVEPILLAYAGGFGAFDIRAGREIASHSAPGVIGALPLTSSSGDSVFHYGFLGAFRAVWDGALFRQVNTFEDGEVVFDATQFTDGNCVVYLNSDTNTIKQLYENPLGEYVTKPLVDDAALDPITSLCQRSEEEPLFFATDGTIYRMPPGGVHEPLAATESTPVRIRSAGEMVVVANQGSDSLTVVKLFGGVDVENIPVGRSPSDVAIMKLPDGRFVVATVSPVDQTFTIMTYTAIGQMSSSKTTALPAAYEFPSRVELVPDRLYVVDLVTGLVRVIDLRV